MEKHFHKLNVASVCSFRKKLGENLQDAVRTFIWGLKPEAMK